MGKSANGKTVFVDVDLAIDVKKFINSTTANIAFASMDLKGKILDAEDNGFLMVRKSIGSDLTILSVDIVYAALVKKNPV